MNNADDKMIGGQCMMIDDYAAYWRPLPVLHPVYIVDMATVIVKWRTDKYLESLSLLR